ncbi:MAG: hypothetical protein ACRC6K_08680 [Fusobacteriaceae bacterium]
MEKEKSINRNIIRVTLAISTGLLCAKYSNLAFNFQIPITAMVLVTSLKQFSLKLFFKTQIWIYLFASLGLFFSEIFRYNQGAFAIATFTIIFTGFYFSHNYASTVRSGILGYSFASIYASYSDKNVESMVRDLSLDLIIGGLIGFILLTLIPTKEKNHPVPKINRENIHKNIKHIFILSFIVFSIWISYMFLDIRDTFFAYATLTGIYGNIHLDKIHKLSIMNILCHILGCFLAIIFSFIMDGMSLFPPLFFLSLLVLFYPIIYLAYYSEKKEKRAFYLTLIGAIVLPLSLYLTPESDIVEKASARALQISLMLIVSLFITKLLILFQGDENIENNKTSNIILKNK